MTEAVLRVTGQRRCSPTGCLCGPAGAGGAQGRLGAGREAAEVSRDWRARNSRRRDTQGQRQSERSRSHLGTRKSRAAEVECVRKKARHTCWRHCGARHQEPCSQEEVWALLRAEQRPEQLPPEGWHHQVCVQRGHCSWRRGGRREPTGYCCNPEERQEQGNRGSVCQETCGR